MPMVAQQNQMRAVVTPSLRVLKRGRMRSAEKSASLCWMMFFVEGRRRWTRGRRRSSTTASRISSVSQVFRLFFNAMPWTTATASAWRPRERRYFGDSNMWKRKKRMRNMVNVMPPMVMTKWRQPWLAGELAMKCQAKSDAHSCPIGHQTESRVKRELDASGRNSRKRAPSTGRLPPTPKPRAAYMMQTPLQLGAHAEAVPNTLAMSRVRLKAMRRPMMSEPMPQKKLPRHKPTKREDVV